MASCQVMDSMPIARGTSTLAVLIGTGTPTPTLTTWGEPVSVEGCTPPDLYGPDRLRETVWSLQAWTPIETPSWESRLGYGPTGPPTGSWRVTRRGGTGRAAARKSAPWFLRMGAGVRRAYQGLDLFTTCRRCGNALMLLSWWWRARRRATPRGSCSLPTFPPHR